MPTYLSNGRLIAYRVDLSQLPKFAFEKYREALENTAEIVADAPNQNLKVYWQFVEPINDLVSLPPECQIREWVD